MLRRSLNPKKLGGRLARGSKLVAMLVSLIICSNAIADTKRIVCKGGVLGYQRVVEVILDTDDFAKPDPLAEVTILSWTKGDKPIFYDMPDVDPSTGVTHRLPYSVTPKFITVTGYQTLDKDLMFTLDISRSDLTTEYGSCTLEDFAVKL